MKFWTSVLLLALMYATASWANAPQRLKVRIYWGEDSSQARPYYVKLIPASPGGSIADANGVSLEPGEELRDGAWQTHAGAGDVDGVEFTFVAPEPQNDTMQDVDVIWADLIAASGSDTARRLSQDAEMHPDSPKLTVQMDPEGTRGFSVTADQLRTAKAIWIPSLNVYIAAGDDPLTFSQEKSQLEQWKGRRILDEIRHEPEATYAKYASIWQDMGNPAYTNPQSRGPGHIVCLTWDSAIPKFGIDRGAGVWNDYGNPDHFQFWFDFGDIAKGIVHSWKGQRLDNGLPVITTTFEKDGVRYEVEQFAYPLDGPPHERRGDLDMVLLQRVRATNLEQRARRIPVTFSHRRALPSYIAQGFTVERKGDTALIVDRAYHRALLAVSGIPGEFEWHGTTDYDRQTKRVNGTVFLDLAPGASREFVVKLASPMVAPENVAKLESIDFAQARAETIRFWSDYVKRGMTITTPDKAVNDMFTASLWHALRLPRRHGGPNATRIDLPYSNFAYSQTGTPWPVNQAVYVDYMLYALRGYSDIATEELLAQYHNNQEANGHINGFANWVVYTPGMLYAVAQNYLLSRDRAELDRLLPVSMKALDWCLEQLQASATDPTHARGLVTGPLNDGTGEGVWAFNQAYMYAGLTLFGRVLKDIGNPRADETEAAAASLKTAIERAFATASMHSPLVQLGDHTWEPYVPCEVHTPHRMLDKWYPADIDTGPLHLTRLKAIAAEGPLSDSLLNDHEDNLFYKNRGIANEPVYNQQGTAYLLRDQPEAAIRTMYSLMASGFSQTVYEPVEHRWTHGQYFGPPSTDGAWFELFRNMLIHERDDGALVLGLATPRAWFAAGQSIDIERAPTYYGPLSMLFQSSANSGQITASVTFSGRNYPRELLVRLRHPDAKLIRSVTVNGRDWRDFDARKEWVRIPQPAETHYKIVATY